MRGMDSETVDLIATDPPFNAKRLFNAPLGSRQAKQEFDDRWRWDEVTDEWHDLIASDHPAIKEIIEACAVIEGGTVDRLTGKIDTGRTRNSIAAFIAWMAPRVVEMHRLLKPTGVLFLQCDTEANSYLRLLLDAVFGRGRFINEIVRRRVHSKGLAKRKLPENHDTLLVYAKSGEWKWNPPYEPYDLELLQQEFTKEQIAKLSVADQKTLKQYKHFEKGRRYRQSDLQNPNKDRPNLEYEFLGVTRVWRWTKERMEKAYREGRIIQTAPGNVPDYKRYLDEQPGRPRDDIWIDTVNAESSESKWSTRKPLDLYRRIIQCATDYGDMVLDPFAGCATTCVAAEIEQRQWVGIDIDPVAEDETKKRLASGEVTGVNAQEVAVRKSPPRRTDIPAVSDEKIRQSLWNRQGRKCANPYCDSDELRAVDIELDHRIPKSRGGDDDIHNRIGLCGNCNRRKSAKAWGQFLDEERSKQPHPTR